MRVIDLTLTLQRPMRGVDWEITHRLEQHGWNGRMLKLYSHAGTHIDAPFHFGVGSTTIDEIDPARFRDTAWLADLGNTEEGQLLEPAHLGRLAQDFPPGQSLLLRTGWSRYARTDLARYRDRLPRISRSLAQWCVQKRVNMLGVEPPSVADVNQLDEVSEIHRILLEAGILIIEGLTNLHQIRQPRVELCAFPLSIKGSDGAPARVLAYEEEGA